MKSSGPDGGGVSFEGRDVERRDAFAVLDADAGAGFEQLADDVDAAQRRRLMQRRHVGGGVAHVDAGAAVQQQLDTGPVARTRRRVPTLAAPFRGSLSLERQSSAFFLASGGRTLRTKLPPRSSSAVLPAASALLGSAS